MLTVIPTSIKTDITSPSPQIKPVAPVSPLTAILDSQTNPADFIEGQKYSALIEALLFNGNSRVLVDGKLLQMKLPENFQPGKKLELVFISHKPDPQFLVLNQVQNDISNNNNSASISPTGRLLGSLMQDALKPGTIITNSTNSQHATTPVSINSQPVSSGISINSTELPGLLQKAITQSGLFYESHQAQWIQGETTLENLQQEPQGKLLMLVSPEIATAKAAMTASMNPEISINSQTIPIVQQQLTTLETGHLFWRGEIWQGQIMDWDIHEEPRRDEKENSQQDQPQQWHTQIRLSMPHLGDITATITLNAQDVNITLSTPQPATAELLKNNQTPLATGLHSAGVKIRTLEINYNDNE